MTPLAKGLLDFAIEHIRVALDELQEQAQMVPAPAEAVSRKKRAIAAKPKAAKALASIPPPPAMEARVVVVAIDEKPPRLALLVDDNPKPGFKTIRLKAGRGFSTVEHRVLDVEVLRDATVDERAHGLSKAAA